MFLFLFVVPRTIGGASELDVLLLRENDLTGPIPSEVGLLTKLQSK